METLGVVRELWRFPVKSMQGERVEAGVLGPASFDGDRRWAVRDTGTGLVLSAKRHGALLQASAATNQDDTVTITLPDGRSFATDDPEIDRALSAWLGAAVTLAAADGPGRREFEMGMDAEHPDENLFEWPCPEGTFLDLASAHLLTTASLDAARRLHPEGDWDVRRFRPTAVIEVDGAGDGFVEDAWVGRTMTLGGARLDGLMPTVRCPMPSRAQPGLRRDTAVAAALREHHDNNLGLYCTVTAAGPVRIGDELTSLDAT